MKKLIFDVETNGLNNCSVLSFSALLINDKYKKLKKINRFYYRLPNEPINAKAISINHLTDTFIKQKRRTANYPRYFCKDKYIEKVINNCDVLIAHNISFDFSHIKNAFANSNFDNKKLFCTMKKTQYLYDAPFEVYGEPKWPTLFEATQYFKIDVEQLKNDLNLSFHSSLFDVYCCYEIYKKLTKKQQLEFQF